MALQYYSQLELTSSNKIYHQNDPLIYRLRVLKSVCLFVCYVALRP